VERKEKKRTGNGKGMNGKGRKGRGRNVKIPKFSDTVLPVMKTCVI